MINNHTPGPWVSEPCDHTDCVDVWCGNGIGHVASVSTGLTPDPSAKANARLIAAAPCMLEALQNLENDDGKIPKRAWKIVQAAIANATGKESR